jgi:hypothetical protein
MTNLRTEVDQHREPVGLGAARSARAQRSATIGARLERATLLALDADERQGQMRLKQFSHGSLNTDCNQSEP